MKIIVCGAGQVGTGIARQLVSEDHHVTIIEESAELLKKATESLEVTSVKGSASHPKTLEQAGAAEADMIIGVTLSDEVNMITCQVAHSLFKVPTKVARIRHQNYLQPIWKDLYRKDHLPIDYIISPEKEVAKAILNRLHAPGALDMIPLADNRIETVEIRMEECSALNIPIRELYERTSDISMKIIAIERKNKLTIPDEEAVLKAGDGVFVVVDTNHLQRVMSFFNHDEKEARRIVIFGGGNIGLFLSQALEAEGHDTSVKIIELNKERAEYIASKLPHTTILNGSSLDKIILEESGVRNAEIALSITNDDEVNIFSALLAKQMGCKSSIVLLNKIFSYSPLITSLGIDIAVNPRETTVSSILQHVRRGNVKSAHSICSGQGEIIETQVSKLSSLVGRTISDLDLPNGVLVGAICRNDEVIMPTDSTTISENDIIIIMSKTEQVKKVDELFSDHLDFF